MLRNENHEKFINTAIDHLLDLNLRVEDIKSFIKNLNELIAGKVDEHNEHYFLSQCLLFPERFLPGLEQYGQVRISEVQAYIIKKITDMLKKVATSSRLRRWGWHEGLIQLAFSKNTNLFETVPQVHDDLIPPMWSLPECPTSIYTQNIRASYSGEVFLQVTVNLDPFVFEEVKLTIPYFNYDSEEEAVVAGVLAVAERRARGLASRAAIGYLQQQGQLYSEEDIYLVQHNRAAKRIITNQYWFNELLACDAEDFMFSRIARLNPLQADNLTSRSVIDLIIRGIFEVDDVLNISPGLLSLIEDPFYFAQFKDANWCLEWFEEAAEATSEEVYKVLSHPRVIWFLKSNLMTLEAAFALPLYLLRMNDNQPSILTSNLYDDYFLRQNTIAWPVLTALREDHCLFLMDANVADVILNGDVSIDFIAMQSEEVMTLLNAGFLSLSACIDRDVMQLNIARLKYMFHQSLEEGDKNAIMENILQEAAPDSVSELFSALLNHIAEQMYEEILRSPVDKRAPLIGMYRLHATSMEESVGSRLIGLAVAAEKILNEFESKKKLGPNIFLKAVSSQDKSSTRIFCKRLVDFVKFIEQAMPDLFREQQVAQRARNR